jgi:sugar-phosphatase
MFKAVIFDMDGLLVNSEPFWREAEKEVFAKVNIRLTDEMCFKTAGLRIDEVVAYWYNKFPWNDLQQEDIIAMIINKMNQLIEEKAEPMPGVYNILDYFTHKNLAMAIASASPMLLINTVVNKLNIRNYFCEICSAENEKYGKPHPDIYLRTAQKLNYQPGECLVFEDSFNGIIAAKAARMKVVAVPEAAIRGHLKFYAADMILNSLEEFNDDKFYALCND